ncbi:AKT5 [Symbiodinium natans]|uniref:AKT5 protein n=1 Tax=Symbiodinium natans TaxID=878477 RepID=A0A812L0B4_9DINO|nr:AKT5 [Symbiodinium natans]
MSLQNAVDSIPCYVQMSRFFFVLAPVMKHADTGKLLSKYTWTVSERSWTRKPAGGAARSESPGSCLRGVKNVALLACNRKSVVVESAEHQYLMVPFDSWLRPAGEGQPAGRTYIELVIYTGRYLTDGHFFTLKGRNLIQKKLDALLKRQDFHSYRLLLNMRHIHLQMRMGEARKRSAEPATAEEAEALLASFLQEIPMGENRFKRFSDREFGWTPTCFAALRGDAPLLKALLRRQANVNECVKAKELELHGDPGMSLLHLAAQFGNNEALQLLIQEKADLNIQDQLGLTPLHRAALGDNAEGVRCLFQAGCNPTCREKVAHLSATGPAAAWGSLRGLQAVMKHTPSLELHLCLHVAVLGEGASTECVTTLISAGAPLDATMDLHGAILSPKAFRLMSSTLKKAYGPSLSFMISNAIGATPLICSLLVGAFEAAAALLAARADVDRRKRAAPRPSRSPEQWTRRTLS